MQISMSNYIYSADPGTDIAHLRAGFGHAGATLLINDASGTDSATASRLNRTCNKGAAARLLLGLATPEDA